MIDNGYGPPGAPSQSPRQPSPRPGGSGGAVLAAVGIALAALGLAGFLATQEASVCTGLVAALSPGQCAALITWHQVSIGAIFIGVLLLIGGLIWSAQR